MKKLFKIFIVLSVFFFMSCEEKITELNNDPDVSTVATDAQVLTSAIGYLGYVQDADLNSGSFLWSQHYTWGIGVSLGNAERYVAEPDDYDGYWQRAYANCLADLAYLSNSDVPAYRGVADILSAYIYQGLVDHFGDIPYSEAVRGSEGITTPDYDPAADIYADLVVKIDAALAEFENPDRGVIGSEDLIYGGDIDSWIRFANSLKLRILMRTSEVSSQDAAITALIASGSFIETEAQVALIPYSGGTGNLNPMFATFEWGVGDFYFASNATLNVLSDLGDPRDLYFYSVATTGPEAGNLRGINQGSVDDDVPFTDPASDYSGSSPYAYAADNPVVLMSPWEVWFLRAEAAVRYGTADNASAAFSNAITSNFDYIGVPAAGGYISSLNFGSLTDEDDQIDMIAVQKWISMNGTQEDEAWIETRRFDRASSQPFRGGVFQEPYKSVRKPLEERYPNTWLYPSSESSLNSSNFPGQRDLGNKIFWDN